MPFITRETAITNMTSRESNPNQMFDPLMNERELVEQFKDIPKQGATPNMNNTVDRVSFVYKCEEEKKVGDATVDLGRRDSLQVKGKLLPPIDTHMPPISSSPQP